MSTLLTVIISITTSFSVGAWLINPYVIANRRADVRVATWRILYGLSAGFSIMVACASALLQPSIRSQLLTQKYSDAIESLKQLYTINKCKHRDSFEVNIKTLIN